MKKTLLFASALSAMVFSAQAQVFTNGGMETWRNYTATSSSLQLEAPNGWFGVDSLIAAMAPLAGLAGVQITPVKQLYKSSGIKRTGDFSAEVRSGFIGETGGNIPGVLVNAQVSVDLLGLLGSGSLEDPSAILQFLSYTGGTPVTGVVDKVTAWLRMGDGAMDDGVVSAYAVKIVQGSAGDSTVFLGTGSVTISASTSQFTEVEVPISYAVNETPQKLIVVFTSSDISADSVHDGNSMYVDDASFSYQGTAIRQPLLSSAKVLVYPNPASDLVYFNLNAAERAADYRLTITDIAGRTVSQETLSEQINAKNVAGWVKGSYCYTLTNTRTGNAVKGKFVVR